MKPAFTGRSFLAWAVLAASPAYAHHSISANYFVDQTTKLEGDVTDFSYKNPHAIVRLDIRNAQTGQLEPWILEWAPVRRLDARGVTKDSLKPGDHVIVQGNPSRKTGDRQIFIRGILRPLDGWKSGNEIKQIEGK